MAVCNRTLTITHIHEVPLVGNLTFHHLALYVSGASGLLAATAALFVVYQHATHYSVPAEQRHAIRVALAPPVYALASFLAVVHYRRALYYEVIRDCYEPVALASFAALLRAYAAPTRHAQNEYFRSLPAPARGAWPWPFPRSALARANALWAGVLQYCVLRVVMTVVSAGTHAAGRYCETSLSPRFAQVWVLSVEAVSSVIAAYCLFGIYQLVKSAPFAARHRPLFKTACVALVVFFSAWQTLLLTLLTTPARDGAAPAPIRPSRKLSYPDLRTGLPNALLCVQMAVYAALFVGAFSWRPYVLGPATAATTTTSSSDKHASPPPSPRHRRGREAFSDHDSDSDAASDADDRAPDATAAPTPTYKGGPHGLRALLHALDPSDAGRAAARLLRPSRAQDARAGREEARGIRLAAADMGRSTPPRSPGGGSGGGGVGGGRAGGEETAYEPPHRRGGGDGGEEVQRGWARVPHHGYENDVEPLLEGIEVPQPQAVAPEGMSGR